MYFNQKQMLISCYFKSYIFNITYTKSGKLYEAGCEYELDILSNTKVSLAKSHGENYMKLRPFLAHHLLRNRLFLKISK